MTMNCRSMCREHPSTEDVAELFSLFGAMTLAQSEVLAHYLEPHDYAAGQCVFKQGSLPHGIYLLRSGNVDFVVEREGVAQLSSSYTSGSIFGESAFLGIQPHAGSAYVRGCSSAEIYVLTRDALMDLQSRDQILFAMLMMNLSREISRKYHDLLACG